MTPEQVLERAQWLVKSQSKRVDLQEELSKLFRLDWNDGALANKPDWVQEIKDPNPFNTMQWLVDVLAHDEPSYRIEIPEGAMPVPMPPVGSFGDVAMGMGAPMPPSMGMMGQMSSMPGMVPPMTTPPNPQEQAAEMADSLENMVKEVYRQNDMRLPTSTQRDELYSAFVMGMIVNKTADLRLSPRWKWYAQTNKGASPFYIKTVTPSQVYYEYDEYGVCEVMHRYMRPLKEVVRLYGGSVIGLNNVKAESADGLVRFCEYWTHEDTAKWIEQIDYSGDADENYFTNSTITGGYFVEKPTANPLGFIPYDLKIARGSSIFSRTEQVYPHLYSVYKSKLALRNNLFFTVAATLAFMLVNPQWVQKTSTPENPVQLDFSRPAVHGIGKDDDITPLEMRITPEFKEVMTLFASKIEESTVSKVVAGQSPGGVTAASGINLLMGGGKLTVSGVQAALSEVRAANVLTILNYIRKYPQFAGLDPTRLEMFAGNRLLNIDPASLPDRINVHVNYQPFLANDQALAVQTWLTPLMQQLISSDFFYEKVGITDAVTMRNQIQQDKDRILAEQQFNQQMQPPAVDPTTGQPIAQQQPQEQGIPGTSTESTVVQPPTSNPQADNANPADQVNAIMNMIENPMGG